MRPRLNPYSVSERPLEGEIVSRSVGLLVTGAIIGVMSGYVGVRMPISIRTFEEMYKGFGADVPGATRVILEMPYAWYLVGAIGIALAAWIIARPEVRRAELAKMKFAARAFILLFALAFGFTAYAIYLPLFKLSEVV